MTALDPQKSKSDSEFLNDGPFNKSIIASALTHGIFVIAIVLKAAFFPSEVAEIQHAVRVDFVGLPEKPQEPPKEAAPAPEPTPAPQEPAAEKPAPPTPKPPSPPPEIPQPPPPLPTKVEKTVPSKKPKETKQAQKSAIERLKAFESLKKRDVEERQSQEQARQEAIKNFKFKGNKVSPGTALTGIEKLQHDDYLERVQEHVKKFWDLPAWLSSENLKARVRVRINSKGLVIDKTILQSSHNEVFDELVLETVKKASPFPEPPSKFEAFLEVDGLQLRFPN